MNRFLGRLTRSVTKPWQMYPVGLLFGLGFDTATEVALLVLAGAARRPACPGTRSWSCRSCSPPGCSLLDTIDGSFMNFAYGWAFSKPVRKVYYNLTITGLSVAVALIIGSVELLGLLAEKAGLSGGFWDWIAGLDLNFVGYAIVGLFVVTWVWPWRSGGSAGSRNAGAPPSRSSRLTRDVSKGSLRNMSSDPRPLTSATELRALSHPTRLALMELLDERGPLTATQAGEHLGESPRTPPSTSGRWPATGTSRRRPAGAAGSGPGSWSPGRRASPATSSTPRPSSPPAP